jgi:multimeric flavodoxin WrbA
LAFISSFPSSFPSFSRFHLHLHSRIPTGSPWGAGTFAAADGSRQPTPLELEIATIQGKAFYGIVSKVKF